MTLKVDNKGYVDSWNLMDRQLDQQQANYNSVGMSDGRACASCRWFVSPNGCVIVSGDISPTGLSDYYMVYQEDVQEPIDVRVIKEVTLKEKATSFFSRLFGQSPSIGPAVQGGNFSIKELDGVTRFYLRVSNNFQDREDDIISLSAHKEYIEWVEAEKAYPELWVWHAAGSRLGQADLLDVSNGVLVASGVIDEGMVAIAKSIAESGEFDGASHGFLHASKGQDIVKYRSYEISLVPRKYSSNLAGGGTLLTKELKMAFSPEKKAVLSKYFGDEQVTKFEEDTAALQKQFEDLGIQSKEIDASVNLAESIQALTQGMTEGFQALNASLVLVTAKANETAQTVEDMKIQVAAATKSLEDAVDDAIAPRTVVNNVVPPSQSDKNLVTEHSDKELVAATKSSDWMNDVVANIVKGL